MATKVQRISPLTGRLTNYIPITTNVITSHFASPPTSSQVVSAINAKFLSEGRDAICDDALIVQGVISDTVHPNVLVSEAEASLDGKSLFDPFTIMLIVGIALVALGCAVIAYSQIKYLNENKYAPPAGSGGTGLWTWEQEISWLTAHYWYVCGKDLTVIGDKSIYASPTAVPQADVDWFTDHCSNASTPDISPKNGAESWVNYIVYGVVIIGAVYIAAKVIPSFLVRRRRTE